MSQRHSNKYKEYLKSPEWQARRRMKIKQAGYRCQLCNSTDLELHVHHRTYDNLGDEHPEDLTVLCRVCHGKFHDDGQAEIRIRKDQKQRDSNILYHNLFIALGRYMKVDSKKYVLNNINFLKESAEGLLIEIETSTTKEFWQCLKSRQKVLSFFGNLQEDYIYAYEHGITQGWYEGEEGERVSEEFIRKSALAFIEECKINESNHEEETCLKGG